MGTKEKQNTSFERFWTATLKRRHHLRHTGASDVCEARA